LACECGVAAVVVVGVEEVWQGLGSLVGLKRPGPTRSADICPGSPARRGQASGPAVWRPLDHRPLRGAAASV